MILARPIVRAARRGVTVVMAVRSTRKRPQPNRLTEAQRRAFLASAGGWRQWGNAIATVSVSAFGGQEQSFSTSRRMRPNPVKATAPPSIADTLPDSIQVTVTDSSRERRGWNDAEVSLTWGAGRCSPVERGVRRLTRAVSAARRSNRAERAAQAAHSIGGAAGCRCIRGGRRRSRTPDAAHPRPERADGRAQR